MKFFNYGLLIAVGISFTNCAKAKIAHYQEDVYLANAPQEINELVEKAAELTQFTGTYEVVIPKKAALAINPWNKFLSGGINPATKNPIIIANPSWLLALDKDQQLFLVSRWFLSFKHGMLPNNIKAISFAFLAISILLIIFLFIVLGKTKLAKYNKGVRLLIACVLVSLNNVFFMSPLTSHLSHYLAIQHDHTINQMTLKLTGNKDAAIKALEFLDTSIKNELKDGETFFEPHQNLFAGYAHNLQSKSSL